MNYKTPELETAPAFLPRFRSEGPTGRDRWRIVGR